MDNTSQTGPFLIELDDKTRQEHYDRAAAWFKNVQLTQASFRQLLEDTVVKIEEPHIKDYLSTMLEYAKENKTRGGTLFRGIGRKPSSARVLLGELTGK